MLRRRSLLLFLLVAAPWQVCGVGTPKNQDEEVFITADGTISNTKANKPGATNNIRRESVDDAAHIHKSRDELRRAHADITDGAPPAMLLEQEGAADKNLHGYALAKSPPFLFIGILSPSGRSEHRRLLRRTWLSQDILVTKRYRHEIAARFMVSKPSGSGDKESYDGGQQMAQLEQEAKDHADVVILPTEDSEGGPARRAIEFLRWFSHNRKERFVLKLDEDTFPQLGRIIHLIHMQAPAEGKVDALQKEHESLFVGRMAPCHRGVHRGDGQGMDAQEEQVVNLISGSSGDAQFVTGFFPPHMSEGGYLLSRSIAEAVAVKRYDASLAEAGDLPEGVAVGLMVNAAMKKGEQGPVHYIPLPESAHRDGAAGCQESDALSFGISAEDIECMWQQQARAGGICCKSRTRSPFGVEAILLNAQDKQQTIRHACLPGATGSWQL